MKPLMWVNLNGWKRRVEDGPMPFEDIYSRRETRGKCNGRIRVLDIAEPARPFGLRRQHAQGTGTARRQS
jgi:hypothetical protein